MINGYNQPLPSQSNPVDNDVLGTCNVVSRKINSHINIVITCCTFYVGGVPHTGRMHQIRVHLQWLGYPIINDPIYNHKSWGLSRGRGGVSEELAHKVRVLIYSWDLNIKDMSHLSIGWHSKNIASQLQSLVMVAVTSTL